MVDRVPLKVVIAGSRSFNDYDKLRMYCDCILGGLPLSFSVEIVSGTAGGADMLGERYAAEKGYSINRFVADWSKYGKQAGPIRNVAMAKYADRAIIFWDSKSPGTRHMINAAINYCTMINIIKTTI
jgi:hypothetical protein